MTNVGCPEQPKGPDRSHRSRFVVLRQSFYQDFEKYRKSLRALMRNWKKLEEWQITLKLVN